MASGPSAGSSATQTARYIRLSIPLLGMMSVSGPQANSLHWGLLGPHKFRVSVDACSAAVAVFGPQHNVTWPPAGSVFGDVIGPSMNADFALSARMSFHLGINRRSSTTRSTAASAA